MPAPVPIESAETTSEEESSSQFYGVCRSQPRAETGVDAFLDAHPDFDGRGTIIAVLDTGVDPAADGLKVTSDGRRKVIELCDCTGAGDVDTSAVVIATDGIVTGLSGRKLKIPETWKNPSGKFHVGLKNIFELYSGDLKTRLKKIRKERLWDASAREHLVSAQRALLAHEDAAGKEPEALEERLEREELTARVSALKELEKNYEDPGPVADCLVFFDGKDWKACVDTSYSGRLIKSELLGTFRDTGDYAKLCEDDLLTYSVNIHNNGKVLEIVVTPGSHGTHVASMAAAHYPGDRSKDGIAPGAQVVSMLIGDGRLGTMEVGSALTRALHKCVELGVDVINYSFGEAAHVPNVGRVVEALEETVWKHKILFVSSAGNNGPALSTGGAPGSTSDACFGIGAYLSPEMMAGLYSLREKGLPSQLFPWSSRGPTVDGAMGTCVSAPGGAITGVPKWTLRCSQLMNGTSMSSPHVSGCVALLMSGLKARDLPSSPFLLRTALEATARLQPNTDTFSAGRGLVQIPQAWAWLEANGAWLGTGLTRIKATIGGRERGVYLREPHQATRPRELLCAIEPVFREDFENEAKRALDMDVGVSVVDEEGAPVSWVRAPETLQLMNHARSFTIDVDPSSLANGSLNYAQMELRNLSHPEAGPIAVVPITVVRPIPVPADAATGRFEVKMKELSFGGSDALRRLFFAVPNGATYAVVKLTSREAEKLSRYVVHAVQLLPDTAFRASEFHRMVSLTEKGRAELGFKVQGGRTLELCLSKWWTSLGESAVDVSMEFHGLAPLTTPVILSLARPVRKLDVSVPLAEEELQPSASLKFLHQPIRPSEALIKPLGERDKFQEERQIYQLRLAYSFNIPKSGTEVTISTGSTDGLLYESPLDSQLWQLFDTNKRFLGAGEAFPTRTPQKLTKGDHTVLLQFRHDSEAVLEKLKDQILTVRHKLEKPIPVDLFGSFADAFAGKDKLAKSFSLYGGSRKALYIATPPDDKLPKGSVAGWWLSGDVNLCGEAQGKRVSNWPLTLPLAAAPVTGSKKDKEKKKPKGDLNEHLRDTRLGWLSRVSAAEGAGAAAELIRDFPDHLPVYSTRLKKLAEKSHASERGEILWLAGQIEKRVELAPLLIHAGTKNDVNLGNTATAAAAKMEMEKKRTALVEAWTAKGVVLTDIYLEKEKPEIAELFKDETIPVVPPTPMSTEGEDAGEEAKEELQLSAVGPPSAPLPTAVTLQELDAVYASLLKLADASDSKVLVFTGKAAAARGHFARASALFAKANEERPSKWLDDICLKLYEKLGWSHVVKYRSSWSLVKFPKDFRLF